MTSDILEAVLPGRHKKIRFPSPPAGTYAVWMEDIETDGPDGMPPSIFTHTVAIEVYEQRPDEATESALEAEMSSRGLLWTKQERYWLKPEQMYQVVYDFTYIEKRSV